MPIDDVCCNLCLEPEHIIAESRMKRGLFITIEELEEKRLGLEISPPICSSFIGKVIHYLKPETIKAVYKLIKIRNMPPKVYYY